MFWESESGKSLIKILIVFAIVFIPFVIYGIILHSQPVQKEQAVVISKRTADRYIDIGDIPQKAIEPYCYITFRLSDSSEKEIIVKNDIYDILQEGDTGILSYKETKGGNRHFISFEKDEQ